MDGRKYYVMCEDKCLFEAMTKEETLAAITQAVSTGEIKDVDTGFVTKIKEQNASAGLSFWIGTQAEYNALETKANNCLYIVTNDEMTENYNNRFEYLEELTSRLNNSVAALEEDKAKKGVVLYENANTMSIGDAITPDLCKYELVEVHFGSTNVALCFVDDTGYNVSLDGTTRTFCTMYAADGTFTQMYVHIQIHKDFYNPENMKVEFLDVGCVRIRQDDGKVTVENEDIGVTKIVGII